MNLLKVLKQLYNGHGSDGSSISGDDLDSDVGDPIHDDSIINELFYKTQVNVFHSLAVHLITDHSEIHLMMHCVQPVIHSKPWLRSIIQYQVSVTVYSIPVCRQLQ